MADDLSFPSSNNKRKFDDPSPTPPPRRPTGFSAPVSSSSPDAAAAAAPAAYNNVPPPAEAFELAKQKAQQIVARIFNESEHKRPRGESGGDDDKGFDPPAATDYYQKPSQQVSSQAGMPSSATYSSYGGYQGSRKIDIPNARVGVIIGKSGDTIKYLQAQSGARIQVTRDNEVVPYSQTRAVELTGTTEQIDRAEELIKGVLTEAEEGGSGIGVPRKSYGGSDQFSMKVPNDKVGLIIGKGGENIKNMQAQSGARIQLIPLHLPPGDTSTERMVQIDGTAEQIEAAKQLVNEVVNSNRGRYSQGGGYAQQGYRPPRPPTSWGPPGQNPVQQPGYYMQPGGYPGAPPQYNTSQPAYGGYPQPPASGGYPTGYDQSSNPSAQQTTSATGYDYYNQQQQQPQQQQADNSGYNYGQPPSYNSQGSYGDTAYAQPATNQQQQSYVQDSAGYYAPAAQPGYSQPAANAQGGYDQQQGYNSAPAYGAVTTNPQDGSATAYGAQGGTAQAAPSQEAHAVQPYPNQQAYATYPAQGAGYAGQPPVQPGYPQSAPPSQPPAQGQKSPANQVPYGQAQQSAANQVPYGQAQQSAASQPGYVQPVPVQPGYELPQGQTGYYQDSSNHGAPPSGYGSAGSQPGYGQQQSYGAAPPPSQPGYGQQQQ